MRNKNCEKSQAITLAEVLIVLVLIGTLMVMTLSNGKKALPNIDKTRCKKAYNTIEKVLSNMLNDDNLYPQENGFADTRAVTTQFGEVFGGTDVNTKFRDAFKYEVNAVKDNIPCKIYNGSTLTEADCFKTEDGTVFGIPDTDFYKTGTKTLSGKYYTPITVYSNFEKNSDAQSGAFFIGVRYNGETKLMTTVSSCNKEPEKSYIQCLIGEYLSSNSLKK